MGMNVLICDDSNVMRRMETRAMKMTGIQVGRIEEAASGLEALDKLANDEIDLLLPAWISVRCVQGPLPSFWA